MGIAQLTRLQIIVLVGIIILGFFLRLYRVDNPIADWHSWRQADTSSVTREFVRNGYDLLHPRYHDLSNVPSGLDNPEGYRFVEFPIYNLASGLTYQVLASSVTIEVAGRLVTIFASLISIFFIFGIVRRYSSVTAGLFAAFFYAVLPFNIYYGRTILPDPSMTASYLGAIYFFILWADAYVRKDSKIISVITFVLSLLFSVTALLLKPFAGFFLLPLVVISYQAFGISMLKRWQLYLYGLLSLVPLVLWRLWIVQFPEGIPVNDWLLNGGNIRFTGAYFFWIFADRLGRLILGYWGIGLLCLGIFTLLVKQDLYSLRKGKSIVFLSFLISSLLYVVIVARGNVQHDYYQIPIVPSLVMLCGIGAGLLFKPAEKYSAIATRILLVSIIGFTCMFGWYHVRDYFNINNPSIVIAGQAVDRLVPASAQILTFYNGDTSFLYQTGRSGWASPQDSMEVLIQKGADYLVIDNPTDDHRTGLGKQYEVVESTDQYLILKLH